jgi:hypothetical protein
MKAAFKKFPVRKYIATTETRPAQTDRTSVRSSSDNICAPALSKSTILQRAARFYSARRCSLQLASEWSTNFPRIPSACFFARSQLHQIAAPSDKRCADSCRPTTPIFPRQVRASLTSFSDRSGCSGSRSLAGAGLAVPRFCWFTA